MCIHFGSNIRLERKTNNLATVVCLWPSHEYIVDNTHTQNTIYYCTILFHGNSEFQNEYVYHVSTTFVTGNGSSHNYKLA